MATAKGRTLEETPTWAVAAVCAIFVIISILMEHGIHSLAKWFQKRQKKAMLEALEKIKAELMLLGFISLLLTVGTLYIPEICIPKKVGNSMLPCKPKSGYAGDDGSKQKDDDQSGDGGDDRRRKLLSYYAQDMIPRRVLAASKSGSCGEGKVELISQSGMHDLHIFIFALALFHVLYSVATILLAKAKMKKWEAWELETSTLEYQYTNDPARFRLTHQTSFVKRHSGFSTIPGMKWIAHFAPNSKFDFHKYIKRSMEDDFKVVVGISTPLWAFAIIFLLLNIYKWHTLTWLSLVPLVILLVVGTKLELIIMDMAEEIQDKNTVVRGAPVVQPSNKYFWFNRPQWILFLIHYTLFQNAFQMAFFLWVVFKYSIHSCFHEELSFALVRVISGIGLHILCSYITFPLYSLVTQMGSHMKKSIFEEQTAKALKNWHRAAKKRNKKKAAGGAEGFSVSGMSGENTPSRGTSPLHLLHSHRQKSSDLPDSVMNSPASNYSYTSDNDLSDLEGFVFNHAPPQLQQSTSSTGIENQNHRRSTDHNIDFSFVKP
ncbi:Mlo-related protein [Corchorus olitorius]|uniref:MLO-like protein n=1 Tax=Corchorus olitorius TaxID=93759 RepID=A0A1R3KQB9_9ROSI|nr:Mlo-related protein [Corchorus olitorius]